MMAAEFSPIRVVPPTCAPLPLVLDSPHSGTRYPSDFGAALPVDLLRSAEDTHVDLLYSSAPSSGATLISARFPRCYIDCNRSPDDIDASMLQSPWPHAIASSKKTALGYGLIWRRLDDGTPIYARALTVTEVVARIENYYQPYWRALTDAINAAHSASGYVYHLNCHSMPAVATHASHLKLGTPHADIVLGDRDGSTCDPDFVALIESLFANAGLKVKRNDPYKGVELVRMHGAPSKRRHSLQIEINRALYMNEKSREITAQFASLKLTINAVIETIASYVKAQAKSC
jgi:N-formylglutamate deformylase